MTGYGLGCISCSLLVEVVAAMVSMLAFGVRDRSRGGCDCVFG